jgi:two-component system nitrate/nitrite response regulator NarL
MVRVHLDATVIIDENSLFREGLKRILATTRFRVTAALREVGELKMLSLNSSSAVLVLTGVRLGEAKESSVRDVKLIKQRYPLARLMVLSERCDLNEVLATFRAGADGYVLNTITPAALMKSLELLMLGETVLPSSILSTALADGRGEIGPPSEILAAHALVAAEVAPLPNAVPEAEISEARDAVSASELDLPERALPPRLSNRETDILACLTEGQSNKTIARKFGVAEATVKVHIKAILRKIRVNNRTQAAIWAVDHALRPSEPRANTASASIVSTGLPIERTVCPWSPGGGGRAPFVRGRTSSPRQRSIAG